MPEFTYDLDPVTRITAHAIGEPGRRVFWIQGRRDRELISLIAEKEQVRALAQAINQLLEDLAEKNPLLSSSEDMLVLASDMSLEEPLESRFRIAQIGIGYDADRDMVILVMQGTQEEGDETPTARFSATRQQMRALSEHAERIVAQGRRICGNCGRPMDITGHFCPQ
ncbi:MAG TPA: DUF3090 family protein, partial [Roseiflexaceae bacterium]|nr:DUF3090 family protein [Roseiflexaceae bacterium]